MNPIAPVWETVSDPIARLCDTNPMLNAMSYAARGIPVFPIIPDDKRPIGSLVPNGFKDRSRDPEVIRAWWSDCPRANIGIVPSDQGLVVLDEDLGADPALVAQLPPTMVVCTPSGGRHHYYDDMFGDYSNADFAPKINVRHCHGYVLAPGSSINGQPYTLETSAKAAIMPAWMRARLAAPTQKPARERTDGPPVSEAELKATLSRINPACSYNDWARVLAAISATPCDGDLPSIALTWSNGELGDWGTPANACGPSYDMENKLDTFRSEGVTYATLLYLAHLNNSAIPPEWRKEMKKREVEEGMSQFLAWDISKISDLDPDQAAAIEKFQRELRTGRPVRVNHPTLARLIESLDGVAPDEEVLTAPIELPNLKFATALEPKMVQWIWNGWLAQGKLHLLAGVSTAGKSTIAFDFAATIARGGQWPDGSPAKQGRVMIWSSEDDWQDTILPRLMAAGYDPKSNRILFVDKVKDRVFNPAEDVRHLYEAAKAFPDLKLLILDPILNVIKSEAKETAKTRADLTPIVTFANETGIGVLGITHFSKNSQKSDPLDRVIGSQATGAYARVVLGAAITSGETRRLVRIKSNISPDGGGFEYRLERCTLNGYEHMTAQHVAWGNRLTGTAKELMGDEAKQSAIAQANDFLDKELANGPVLTSYLNQGALANGISVDSLRRAKAGRKDILVTTAGAKSTWRLAEDHSAEGF